MIDPKHTKVPTLTKEQNTNPSTVESTGVELGLYMDADDVPNPIPTGLPGLLLACIRF